tara:strand:- start:79 stop:291 length:213 start_codon:yes stop_codon:yes gene_type:complete
VVWVLQMILQEAVFHTLAVVEAEEDLQMVLHVELVDLEEIQVDQVQEMMEQQEQQTEVAEVVEVLHQQLE